jgi:3-oxoacyl-[acyl-carrier protein] reductase
MNLELSDKVVLVTGATRGLGQVIAQGFHAEGCVVVGNGRKSDTQKGKAKKNNCGEGITLLEGDVTDAEQCDDLVREVVSRYGRLDIVICNVGSSLSAPPGMERHLDWQRMLEINLIGSTNIVSAATEGLAKSRGSIVCISSICGLETIEGAPITYSASKSALNSYIRGIARPLALRGVRINGVAPGNLIFKGSVWERKQIQDKQRVVTMLDKEVPMKRFGRPEEITDAVMFLASPRASFTTGIIMPVDGGQVSG